jgi:hypothetical protein
MAGRCSGGVPEVFRRRYLWTSPEVLFFVVAQKKKREIVCRTEKSLRGIPWVAEAIPSPFSPSPPDFRVYRTYATSLSKRLADPLAWSPPTSVILCRHSEGPAEEQRGTGLTRVEIKGRFGALDGTDKSRRSYTPFGCLCPRQSELRKSAGREHARHKVGKCLEPA